MDLDTDDLRVLKRGGITSMNHLFQYCTCIETFNIQFPDDSPTIMNVRYFIMHCHVHGYSTDGSDLMNQHVQTFGAIDYIRLESRYWDLWILARKAGHCPGTIPYCRLILISNAITMSEKEKFTDANRHHTPPDLSPLSSSRLPSTSEGFNITTDDPKPSTVYFDPDEKDEPTITVVNDTTMHTTTPINSVAHDAISSGIMVSKDRPAPQPPPQPPPFNSEENITTDEAVTMINNPVTSKKPSTSIHTQTMLSYSPTTISLPHKANEDMYFTTNEGVLSFTIIDRNTMEYGITPVHESPLLHLSPQTHAIISYLHEINNGTRRLLSEKSCQPSDTSSIPINNNVTTSSATVNIRIARTFNTTTPIVYSVINKQIRKPSTNTATMGICDKIYKDRNMRQEHSITNHKYRIVSPTYGTTSRPRHFTSTTTFNADDHTEIDNSTVHRNKGNNCKMGEIQLFRHLDISSNGCTYDMDDETPRHTTENGTIISPSDTSPPTIEPPVHENITNTLQTKTTTSMLKIQWLMTPPDPVSRDRVTAITPPHRYQDHRKNILPSCVLVNNNDNNKIDVTNSTYFPADQQKTLYRATSYRRSKEKCEAITKMDNATHGSSNNIALYHSILYENNQPMQNRTSQENSTTDARSDDTTQQMITPNCRCNVQSQYVDYFSHTIPIDQHKRTLFTPINHGIMSTNAVVTSHSIGKCIHHTRHVTPSHCNDNQKNNAPPLHQHHPSAYDNTHIYCPPSHYTEHIYTITAKDPTSPAINSTGIDPTKDVPHHNRGTTISPPNTKTNIGCCYNDNTLYCKRPPSPTLNAEATSSIPPLGILRNTYATTLTLPRTSDCHTNTILVSQFQCVANNTVSPKNKCNGSIIKENRISSSALSLNINDREHMNINTDRKHTTTLVPRDNGYLNTLSSIKSSQGVYSKSHIDATYTYRNTQLGIQKATNIRCMNDNHHSIVHHTWLSSTSNQSTTPLWVNTRLTYLYTTIHNIATTNGNSIETKDKSLNTNKATLSQVTSTNVIQVYAHSTNIPNDNSTHVHHINKVPPVHQQHNKTDAPHTHSSNQIMEHNSTRIGVDTQSVNMKYEKHNATCIILDIKYDNHSSNAVTLKASPTGDRNDNILPHIQSLHNTIVTMPSFDHLELLSDHHRPIQIYPLYDANKYDHLELHAAITSFNCISHPKWSHINCSIQPTPPLYLPKENTADVNANIITAYFALTFTFTNAEIANTTTHFSDNECPISNVYLPQFYRTFKHSIGSTIIYTLIRIYNCGTIELYTTPLATFEISIQHKYNTKYSSMTDTHSTMKNHIFTRYGNPATIKINADNTIDTTLGTNNCYLHQEIDSTAITIRETNGTTVNYGESTDTLNTTKDAIIIQYDKTVLSIPSSVMSVNIPNSYAIWADANPTHTTSTTCKAKAPVVYRIDSKHVDSDANPSTLLPFDSNNNFSISTCYTKFQSDTATVMHQRTDITTSFQRHTTAITPNVNDTATQDDRVPQSNIAPHIRQNTSDNSSNRNRNRLLTDEHSHIRNHNHPIPQNLNGTKGDYTSAGYSYYCIPFYNKEDTKDTTTEKETAQINHDSATILIILNMHVLTSSSPAYIYQSMQQTCCKNTTRATTIIAPISFSLLYYIQNTFLILNYVLQICFTCFKILNYQIVTPSAWGGYCTIV